MKRLILILLPLMVLLGCNSSQTITISGIVTDSKTNAPIANATVSDGQYGMKSFAVTNANGFYSYQTYCEEHTIQILAEGYQASSQTLITPFIPSSNAITFNISMDPN